MSLVEITYFESEGGIRDNTPRKVTVSTKLLAQFEQAECECQICGSPIDDGEQGCPTPEDH